MLKKVRFVYNPASGETNITEKLDTVIRLYQEHGYTLVPHRLDFKNDSSKIFSGSQEWDHILVAGGDGTLNYIVNIIKEEGIDLPVAILPTGTANDFASLFPVSGSGIEKTCLALLSGNPAPVDLGVVNGSYFLNVFSCGLFTDISQKTPTRLKNTLGKLAYYLGGIGELTHFRKMQIKIDSDGGSYEGSCLIFFVFNGRTAGKLRIAYHSEVDDGLLDVLIVKGDNPIEHIQTLFHYLTPSLDVKEYPQGIVHFRCSHLRAESEQNENTDIDGQAGPSFPLEIRCDAGGLNLIKPEVKPRKRKKTKKPA